MKNKLSATLVATFGAALFLSIQTARPADHGDSPTASNNASADLNDVVHGDYLRLNLNTANNGPGGGDNSAAGFPNGRRVGDDVVDTLLFFIANQKPVPDNVYANDVPLQNAFPFFGFAQQPRDSGIDDNTRN